MKNKEIWYIISFESEIKSYPYKLYKTELEAENALKNMSKNKGQILKVIIYNKGKNHGKT